MTYDEVYIYLDGSDCKYAAEGCTESRKRDRRFSVKAVIEDGLLFHLQNDNGQVSLRGGGLVTADNRNKSCNIFMTSLLGVVILVETRRGTRLSRGSFGTVSMKTLMVMLKLVKNVRK